MQYDVKPLVAECIAQLFTLIQVENAAKLLYYSDLYELTDLKACVIDFIIPNSLEVMKTDDWKEFVEKKPYLMKLLLVKMASLKL